VKELAVFVSCVYVRFWHEASLSIKVPLNDMQLLELLTKYLNRTIVKTAEDTLVDTFGIFQRCSLDCLSSTTELADVRTQMVANLQILASEESVKRPGSPLEPLSATGLASCATERTDTIFEVLSLSGKTKAQNFLANELAEWNDDPLYQELKTAASKIKVVNDNAERAMKLMTLYNSSLTGEQTHT